MLKKGIFFWVTFPMLFTLITVIGVSVYVLHIIVKQSKQVAPIVVINSISAKLKKDEQKEDQMTVEDIELAATVESQEVDEEMIRRKTTDPYMFYRERQLETQPRVAFKCFKTAILEPARRALRINLATLSLLVMMAPHNLLNVYSYFSEEGCTDDLVTVSRLVGLAQYFFVMIYPFILMSKLSNTST